MKKKICAMIIAAVAVMASCSVSESSDSGAKKDTSPKAEKTDYKYGSIDIPGKDGGIVKKCAVEENPKSEIDRYQAA